MVFSLLITFSIAAERTMNPEQRHFCTVVYEKREAEDMPLDLCAVRPWSGWTGGLFICNVCREQCDTGYETYFEWGDSGRHPYFDSLCYNCLNKACAVSRNAANRKYDDFGQYGNIPQETGLISN